MFPGAVTFEQLTADLVRDLGLFVPELVLCGAIPLLLLARLLIPSKSFPLAIPALGLVACAIRFAITTPVASPGGTACFGGMLVIDQFGLFVRVALLGYLGLAILLGTITGIPDRDDAADFFTLLFGATIGLMLMASSRHLLMVFIAMEMASLPSYALAGFHKGKRVSSEAALKYVVFGAAASGTMLYGISLVAGCFGTGSLPAIAEQLTDPVAKVPLSALAGILLILAGMLFKLSAFPMHFWCPDVFTGAAAEVGAFLSVASKAASLSMAARLLYYLGAGQGSAHGNDLALLWGALAAITMTWGNLGAFGQTNIKRMLAYSTIAHAGLMMMTLTLFDDRAVSSLLYYMIAYLFMNLGAFAVVAMVRNATGSEEIAEFDGLVARSPMLGIPMAVFTLSLLGLPPLAGFAAKFQVFARLFENARHFETGDVSVVSWAFLGLLGVAALNTALSAGYYLALVRRMFLDASPQAHQPIVPPLAGRLLVCFLAGAVFALGVIWNPLNERGAIAAKSFQAKSAKQQRQEAGL